MIVSTSDGLLRKHYVNDRFNVLGVFALFLGNLFNYVGHHFDANYMRKSDVRDAYTEAGYTHAPSQSFGSSFFFFLSFLLFFADTTTKIITTTSRRKGMTLILCVPGQRQSARCQFFANTLVLSPGGEQRFGGRGK